MEELLKYAKMAISSRPDLKSEIEDLIQLCRDEIEEGGSVEHEISLCLEDINQLID
jgi:hypothetical protein